MIPLIKPVITLGRQIENDIVFQEEFLSRFHAEIMHENDKYILVDKESISGTFVNGRKIDRCVLNSGDLISLANIFIMFVNNNPKIVGKSMGTTQSHPRIGILEQNNSVDNKPSTILIIDDEPALRLGLAAKIRRQGYEVYTTCDGRDGLLKAREYLPDSILSDVMMPPPNGFELRRLMGEYPRLATIPFIFLTARTGLDDRVNGIRDDADDYITKPFATEELLVPVEAVLRRVRTDNVRYLWKDENVRAADVRAAIEAHIPDLLNISNGRFSFRGQDPGSASFSHRALVAIPIRSGLGSSGFLGFLCSGGFDCWSAFELDAAETAANLIGSALLRNRYEETIRLNNTRNRIILSVLPNLLIGIDVHEKILGYSANSYHPLYIDRDLVIDKKRDVSLNLEKPDLPVYVLGDKSGLQQVFINLINNAVKFSSPGRAVKISVAMEKDHVRVNLADSDVGIP